MSDTILSIENVSKQYQLGNFGTGTIGRDVDRWWARVRGKEDPFLKIGATNDRTSKTKQDFVWALKDINFEVKRGEVLGIIGKNGAGKSTLLKLLSRVTGPTTGAIRSAGRMASLLEVGTGFHPELTGLENIYLNGAILGMTKAEIKRKLDEIIDFSGCAMYIDTPTKRYSSGMTVRLGFAVAAFLDPEILVVDEVLAVGDAEFQKKAIGKMQDVSKGEGRTVLFVSHNMASVKSLCTRGIVLENGTICYDGTIESAVKRYVDGVIDNLNSELVWDSNSAPGDHRFKVISCKINPIEGNLFDIGSGITIEAIVNNLAFTNASIDFSFDLFSSDGVRLINHGGFIAEPEQLKKGLYKIKAEIPSNILNVGVYHIQIWFGLNMTESLSRKNIGLSFEIHDSPTDHLTRVLPGVLRPRITYVNEYLGND